MSNSNKGIDIELVYQEIAGSLKTVLASFPSRCSDEVNSYIEERTSIADHARQDLIPYYVSHCFGGDSRQAQLLTMWWMLLLTTVNFADDIQDHSQPQLINAVLTTIGVMSQVKAQMRNKFAVVDDIDDAYSRALIFGAQAQDVEAKSGLVWSRQEYLDYVMRKAATFFAAGIWSGGRLAGVSADVLNDLRQFGLVLGFSWQLGDDYEDVEEDLRNNVVTLPVIEAIRMNTHTKHPLLTKLLLDPAENSEQIQEIVKEMGGFAACDRLIRMYQIQAQTFLKKYPALEPLFSSYVTPDS